ncbi:U-box domain-containing protein 4-like [Hibiscus syriacus]|uniref:U-box domain-containing protein 4-like n=1 Tax=Hibiscus syriacus TaxID=106335 RepID=UPI0019242158|nr:U-box domain-containing protein 4-like [Hibiscus syriacus]
MEMSLLKALLSNISLFLKLSYLEKINSEPIWKYYRRAKEILKLLKHIILNAITGSDITSDEVLSKAFEELCPSVQELLEKFETWQPLLSKVYFVLKVEFLLSKIQNSSVDIFQFLKSSNQRLPNDLSSTTLEKIKHVGYEQTSSFIIEAIRDQLDSPGSSSEILVKIAESLSLNSKQETLIEAMALEKLKENAEVAEQIVEVEFIGQLIDLVTRMHSRLVLIKQSQTCSPVLIPPEFICPLSLELMADPVIVASGHTYDRDFIKKWIDLGLTVCPQSRQTLAHTIFIPNYTMKALIANWCESNNVKLLGPIKSMSLDQPCPLLETEVKKLVDALKSPSIETQSEATAHLRLLTKQSRDNRIKIARCGAISLLLDLLYSPDIKTQENAVTSLLNLSNIDSNKTAIMNANAIDPLIHVLETGSPVAKENTAAALFSLSVLEENRVKIGRSGAIRPLVDMLRKGTPRGKKDSATALYNLSRFHENKARIVQAGAIRYLVDLMQPSAGMVDKAVFLLAKLATIYEGRTAIGEEGGIIPVLVEVVELGSERGKENAAAALLLLCTYSNRYCNLVLKEGAVPPLLALSQSGTPRAKEKAQALLSFFRNYRHGNAGRG